MPNDTSGYLPEDQGSTASPPPASVPSDEQSTIDVAKAEAGDLGSTTKEAGTRVAATAQEQAGKVAGEAKRHAGNLIGEAGVQVKDQADGQKDKAAGGLRSLSKELQTMAESSHESGLASDLAMQASQKSQELADWLDRRDSGGLVGEVREFARRKPGTFLLGCALAGIAAGRLTRGAIDVQRTDSTERGEVAAPSEDYDGGAYALAAGDTAFDPLVDPLPTAETGPTGGTYGVGAELR